MRRTPLRRKTALKRGGPIKLKPKTIQKLRDWQQRSRVAIRRDPTKRLGPGKKTKTWNTQRRGLKQVFADAGITTCELCPAMGWAGCWHDNALGFAHSHKRLSPHYDAHEVILACNPGHDRIEVLPEEEMCAIVKRIISERKIKIANPG